MSRGEKSIRAAVDGADRAFAVIDGGRKGGKGPPPAAPQITEWDCPVTPVGQIDGRYVFLDRVGQKRELSAKALGSRHDMLSLFGHDDAWLRWKFPKTIHVKRQAEDGTEITDDVVVDFVLNKAAGFLGSACFACGMFGDHIVLRRPGVWPHNEVSPAIHCGDQVRIGADWRDAGYRSDNTIWAAAPAVPRPGIGCDASIGRKLQERIQRLFRFRAHGGGTAVLGLLGTAYFGGAARWRSAGFLLGPAGCGKSTLLEVMQACCPLHFFSNDTSKAGLEQGLDGRAMPCFLDENEKTGDQRGAQNLLDLVLTASGSAGTRGVRGGADGRGRRIEVVCSVVMAATAPPEMRETHLGRFAMIELERPEEGADYRSEHAQLVADMKGLGAQLWGRALGAWERYNASLAIFRMELQRVGCAPREMDQLGAILAGWWILVEEGLPDARGAMKGVLALEGLVRTAAVVAEESNARRLVQFLLSYAIQLDRSTAREPIANLMEVLLKAGEQIEHGGEFHIGADMARRALLAHGIRVIRKNEPATKSGPAPRKGECAGVWFATQHTELQRLFIGSDWEGARWLAGIRDLPSAMKSEKVIAFGGARSRGIWISAMDLGLEEPIPEDWTPS